jgi:mono/diheme cytochrome c family protein
VVLAPIDLNQSGTGRARQTAGMRTRYWTIFSALLVAAMAPAMSAQQPTQRSAAQEGRRLALSKCDVCHVVASDQQYRPLLSHYAPSFNEVANRPDNSAQSLQAFLAHPHTYENMPSPDLTPAQVADLVAYILSLRGRH